MIRNRFFRGFRTLCMAALALCCAGFAASAQSRDKVVVASKIDTEGALLGHMVLIALTGWGQQQDRQRTHDAGFDAHLTKPVNYEAIMELLANLPPHAITQMSLGLPH